MARRPAGSVVADGSGDRPAAGGPYDVDALGADLVPLAGIVDFGALKVPVPEDGTVAVEPTDGGRMQAVHITVGEGRLSVSALAAPRSAKLWPDLVREIDASLREGGARVRSFPGEWGRELHATTGAATSVFVGVDGPRWMLYGVATGPSRDAVALDARLRHLVRGTVVVRGRSPYPVRTVLPLVAPPVPVPAPEVASPPAGSAPTTALPVTPAPGGPPAGRRPVNGGRRDVDAGAATAAFSAVVRAARPGPEIAAGSTGPTRSQPGRGGSPRWADPVRRIDDPSVPVDDFAESPTEQWDPLVDAAADPSTSGWAARRPPAPPPPARSHDPAGPGDPGRRRRGPGETPAPEWPPAPAPGRDPALSDPVPYPFGSAGGSTPGALPPGVAPPRLDAAPRFDVPDLGGPAANPWRVPSAPARAGSWAAPPPDAAPGEILPIFESLLAGEPADGPPGRHAAPEGRDDHPEPTGPASTSGGRRRAVAPGGALPDPGRSSAPERDRHRSAPAGAAMPGAAQWLPPHPDHRSPGDGGDHGGRRHAADHATDPTPSGSTNGSTGEGATTTGGRRHAAGRSGDGAARPGRAAAGRADAAGAGADRAEAQGGSWRWPQDPAGGRRRSRDAGWSAADLLTTDHPEPRRHRAAPDASTAAGTGGRHAGPRAAAPDGGRHARPEG